MKLTAMLLLAACLTAAANGFSQTVTLSENNAGLDKVFREIRRQTGYNFIYNDAWLSEAKPVSVSVQNVSLTEALNICFKGQPFTYTIIEKTIALKPLSPGASSSVNKDVNAVPPIDVKGRVVNENGEPVIVNIIVKGTKQGTTTNNNGEFILTAVEEGAVLVLSSINLQTIEVKITSANAGSLSIVMQTKISDLENVTIGANTGYQQIPKERRTGSFAVIGQQEIMRKSGPDILSRLEGLATGVMFDRRTSAPSEQGVDANNIMIRGLSTFSVGIIAPLIVLNNFPYEGDINNINPNDIESITILKDAAAASIWGAKAANGVIVITTKEAKAGTRQKISFSTSINILEKPDLFQYDRMSVSDYIDMEAFLFSKGYFNNDLSNNLYPAVSPAVEIFARRRAGLISAQDSAGQIDQLKSLDVRNDFSKYLYRSSVNQQYALNVSGASGNVRYLFSGGFDKNPTVLVGRSSERVTFFSNTSMDITKKTTVNLRVHYNELNSINNTAGDFGNTAYSYTSGRDLYPYAQFADADGRSLAITKNYRNGYIDTAGAGKLLNWQYRPLDELALADNTERQRETIIHAGITHKLSSAFSIQLNYQRQTMNSTGRVYYSNQTYYARNLINLYSQRQGGNIVRIIPNSGILVLVRSEAKAQSGRAQLNFAKVFSGKHEINAIAGAEIRDRIALSNTDRTYGFDENNLVFSSMDYLTRYPLYGNRGTATIPQQKDFSEIADRFVSVYTNASYTFVKRYIVSASFRRDASNLFGIAVNDKWKPFWTVGGGWNLSDEKFYKIDWLPYAKLRATFGYQGNVNNTIAPNTIIQYTPTNSPVNGLPSALISVPGNPGLTWENVRQWNIGLDLASRNRRISGSIEYFSKGSDNLLLNAVVDATTGVGGIVKNSAGMKGSGVEINIRSNNLAGKFTWTTEFGLSNIHNTVTKYQYDDKGITAYTLASTSGLLITKFKDVSPFAVYSFRFGGLDAAGNPQGYLGKNLSTDYLSIFNQRPDTAGVIYHGSAIPTTFGFLNNIFSYKNFTLLATVSYSLNYYAKKSTVSYFGMINGNSGHADYALRWQQPGDEERTTVPSFVYPLSNTRRDDFYANSSVNVVRADNIRLQSIRLAYKLVPAMKKKQWFEQAEAYVVADNIGFIWRAAGNINDPAITRTSTYPRLRSIAMGINLVL